MAGQNKCVSSQYNIYVKPDSYAHQYDVAIEFHPATVGRRPCTLTQRGNAFQKARCRYILKNFEHLRGIVYAYDGQAALWTARAIDGAVENVPFPMDDYMRNSLGGDGELRVSLTYIRSVNLSDFSMYAEHAPDAVEDRTLRNVMEMILSQNAIERETRRFASIGAGMLCETREFEFQRGLVIRNGNNKGVHIVKSSQGPRPLLAISSCRKIFYPSNANFLEVLRSFMSNQFNYEEAAKLFKNVKLQLQYNPGRIFTFRGFTAKPLREITLDEGNPETVEAYLYRTYGVQLRHTDFPGALMNVPGDPVFPLEQLTIVADQSIPDSRLPDNLREEALRMNRLAPAQRYAAIEEQFKFLEMNNAVTQGFGIRLDEKMVQGSFHRLEKPTILARRGIHLQSNDFGCFKFDKNQYLMPGRVAKIIVLSSDRDAPTSLACARSAVEECRKKGTVLPNPVHSLFNTRSLNLNDWIQKLKEFEKQNALVMVVDSGTESHALIKLAEAITNVPTQHLMFKTAASVAHKYQTLENIAHKINLKSGGLNHAVQFRSEMLDLNRGNILVIGLDVCHPTGENSRGPTAEPSFVGITGNYLENPCAFAGNFFAQTTRQESVDPLELRAKTGEMLKKASMYRKIDTIILVRDGVSEGQYTMAVQEELHAIQQAANDFFKNAKTKFLGLVVTKSGNVRHFNVSQRSPESLPCRSIVNFGTRENFTQFYIVPHRAFQGLAKAVMCSVLRNDLKVDEVAIQKFVLNLTTLHQIVNSPISLPEPVYQSDKLAQRGQLLYRTVKRFFPKKLVDAGGKPIDYQSLTNMISFNGGELPSIRFTA